MKKTLLTVCAIVLASFTLQSCKTTEGMTSNASELEGEWNIIEINGESVVPGDKQPFPFIGFNTDSKQVYGNAGCNRMTGTYSLGKKIGKLNLGKLGSTMMMCPDMELEGKVHKMLGEVKSYKVIGSQIALYGKMSKPIGILDRKDMISEAVLLSAKWQLQAINGEEVDYTIMVNKNKPYIELDIQKKTVSGNAGCNRITGQIVTNKDVARSMSFPNLASTRMACPNMELENKVLKSLGDVVSYKLNPTTTVLSLLDNDGKETLRFIKINE